MLSLQTAERESEQTTARSPDVSYGKVDILAAHLVILALGRLESWLFCRP